MLCVVSCVLCCLNFFYIVHRGLGPTSKDEDRYVLFWLSYDTEVLGKGRVPRINSDQITKLKLSSKLLSPQNAALVHLGQHENRLNFLLNFFHFLLTSVVRPYLFFGSPSSGIYEMLYYSLLTSCQVCSQSYFSLYFFSH